MTNSSSSGSCCSRWAAIFLSNTISGGALVAQLHARDPVPADEERSQTLEEREPLEPSNEIVGQIHGVKRVVGAAKILNDGDLIACMAANQHAIRSIRSRARMMIPYRSLSRRMDDDDTIIAIGVSRLTAA
jgi:hypothetical protein